MYSSMHLASPLRELTRHPVKVTFLPGALKLVLDLTTPEICKRELKWLCMLVGTSLYSLDVDGAPLSEVLRLHLLSSGARRLSCHARSDLQQRGGYTSHDNPALEFCHGEASIMDALRRASIFQLSPGME